MGVFIIHLSFVLAFAYSINLVLRMGGGLAGRAETSGAGRSVDGRCMEALEFAGSASAELDGRTGNDAAVVTGVAPDTEADAVAGAVAETCACTATIGGSERGVEMVLPQIKYPAPRPTSIELAWAAIMTKSIPALVR